MHKADLVKLVADEIGITQVDAKNIIGATMKWVAKGINNDGRVELAGFGVFKKAARKASSRPNPQDRSQRIEKPAFNTVTFKPSPALKELVNG